MNKIATRRKCYCEFHCKSKKVVLTQACDNIYEKTSKLIKKVLCVLLINLRTQPRLLNIFTVRLNVYFLNKPLVRLLVVKKVIEESYIV